ncbi:hypothetical protein [Paenibacillus glucanolyticus]|uniref:hypothetical protein n=1 Tax=Paenibacillus glucanolyticus TaxID=59843 RepID=UPI0034CD2DCD
MDDTSIFVRHPYEILYQVRQNDKETHFIAQEYFSSLWAVCSLFDGKVINRPNILAWQHDQQSKNQLKSIQIQDIWFSNINDFQINWANVGDEIIEAHIEETVTWKRVIIKQPNSLIEKGKDIGLQSNYRAILASSAEYIIDMCIGGKYFSLLNETQYDTNCEEHISLIDKIYYNMSQIGLGFFAVIFSIVKGEKKIVRILSNPPFHLYSHIEDVVHQCLLKELQK